MSLHDLHNQIAAPQSGGPAGILSLPFPDEPQDYFNQMIIAPGETLDRLIDRAWTFLVMLNSPGCDEAMQDQARQGLQNIAGGIALVHHDVSLAHEDHFDVHHKLARLLNMSMGAAEGVESINRAIELAPTDMSTEDRLELLGLKVSLHTAHYMQTRDQASLRAAHDAVADFAEIVSASGDGDSEQRRSWNAMRSHLWGDIQHAITMVPPNGSGPTMGLEG